MEVGLASCRGLGGDSLRFASDELQNDKQLVQVAMMQETIRTASFRPFLACGKSHKMK